MSIVEAACMSIVEVAFVCTFILVCLFIVVCCIFIVLTLLLPFRKRTICAF